MNGLPLKSREVVSYFQQDSLWKKLKAILLAELTHDVLDTKRVTRQSGKARPFFSIRYREVPGGICAALVGEAHDLHEAKRLRGEPALLGDPVYD
jgi:hypothetical protein